jgi:voltage-gated potassium channel
VPGGGCDDQAGGGGPFATTGGRMKGRLRRRIGAVIAVPILARLGFHVRRITGGLERGFFIRLLAGLGGLVLVSAVLVAVVEGADDGIGGFFAKVGTSFYWAVTTVMGSGDASYVKTPAGFVISWLLVLFGVAIVGVITAALVGFVIDFILKEGQGMGASGYRDHIVVCGWNSTARELIAELRTDEYTTKVVVIHNADKNPAGSGVYFVNGDITDAEDLRRAGIEEAMSAIICPADASNDADMRSILCVLAIEAIAPQVRTVVEVNNPSHVDHFHRANVDEVVVTSRIASRLLARTSLYPGLAEIITDIVSGGTGSELYRVAIPDECVGMSLDELSAMLRSEHSATLLGVNREGIAFVNPPSDFRLEKGDDAVVVAESLGTLAPLKLQHD